MSYLVTRTKVILPQRRKELLSRPRLVNLLYDLLDYKLILVIAPAGYGKTSLLLDFIHQVDLPVCWYSLDALDQTILRFIAYFIAAIHQRFPSFGTQSTIALEAASQLSPDINRLITVIVNDIYEHIKEHFLFVLDDYHLVGGQREIETFVNQFLREASENCHLVLASRTLLTLPDLPLLTARLQVGGLGYEELAFRSDEIQSLILQNHHITISENTALELTAETEGWITGLLLTTQTMWQDKLNRPRTTNITGVSLYDYLAQQVLDQQPVHIREFLLQTSFLEEFDAHLCEAVWGNNNTWSALMNTILQDNLFVLPVGETGQTIRYHHLFRDFLQARYEQERPNEVQNLLRSIAAAYTKQEDWEKAYAAYLRIGDPVATADLVEQAGSTFVRDSRLATLASWIDALPEDVLAQRPTLLSHKGTVLVIKGQVENGLMYLDQAEAALRSSRNTSDLALTLARRATARRFLGKYQASLEDGYEALTICEHNDNMRPTRAEALRAIGMSLYHLGQLSEATEKFDQSLAENQSLGEFTNVALVQMELGMCLRSTGRFRQALEHYEQALAYWRKVNNTTRMSIVLNNLGVLYHLTGDYIRAVELFEEALAHARRNHLPRSEAYLLCGIGDLYMDLDADAYAQNAYTRTREIAEQIDDRFLLLYVSVVDAAKTRRRGELTQARTLLQTARELAQKSTSSYETALWRMEAGQIDLAERNTEMAIEHLSEAAKLFTEGGQKIESARVYMLLARACYLAQDKPAAFTALEQSITLASSLESQHVLVIGGRESQDLLSEACRDSKIGSSTAILLNQIHQFEDQMPSLRRRLRPKASTILFAPPKLTIRVLGKVQVELDGKPVTTAEWLNQKRVRELFYLLLAHPKGKTREEIGAILWQDSSPTQLKLQFKNAVYRLRYALGQEIVIYDGYRYCFNSELDYEYDAQIYEEKVNQAKTITTPAEKITLYRSVVDMYRGPYLPEGEGTWVLAERERLWQLQVEAFIALVWLCLESGDYSTALEYAHRILREDRCQEEAHRLAMRAYAALGNRAAIKKQYDDCYWALQQDVDSEPSLQTQLLYKTLLER
jgi:ATP/maltotriose-dependent transcriptional regulator MalT/DNA-binding SARP family transcriptional activator